MTYLPCFFASLFFTLITGTIISRPEKSATRPESLPRGIYR